MTLSREIRTMARHSSSSPTLLYQENDAFRARAFLQRFDALGQPTAASLKLGHDIETRMGNPEGAQNYRKRLLSQFPDSEQAHALEITANSP